MKTIKEVQDLNHETAAKIDESGTNIAKEFTQSMKIQHKETL